MITSWYWHLLLLCLGGMAVGGKAIALRDPHDLSITFDDPITLKLNENGTLRFTPFTNGQEFDNLGLILLQVEQNGTQAPSLVKVLDVQASKKHGDLGDVTIANFDIFYPDFSIIPPPSNGPTVNVRYNIPLERRDPTETVPVYLKATDDTISTFLNLVFCIGPITRLENTCNFYSNIFDLEQQIGSTGSTTQGITGPTQTTVPSVVSTISALFPTSYTITSTASTPQLAIVQLATAPPNPSSTGTLSASVASTVTIISTSTTALSTPEATSSSKHTSGLSTGAKIGIALGSFALLSLLLLLALYVLRKQHSKRAMRKSTSQPEQVLLTRDMHTDSFTRNQLILEKERNGSSTIVPHDGIDTPLEGNSPTSSIVAAAQQQQRHSALSPYEALPSAPYNGSISPRRKPAPSSPTHAAFPLPPRSSSPQNNHPQSQNPNPNTTSPPHSSSSTSSSPPTLALNFEAYHDIPLYGDARHVPQVFTNSISERERERGIESPFLREEMEGMTPEEVARLEEEERRIDAAIAAAEAGR